MDIPTDRARASVILEDVYTKSKGTSYYARDAVPVEIAWDDPEAALDLVRRTEGVITDSVLVGAISAQAQVAPASAVAWGQPLLAQILDPAMRLYAVVQLGMAAAPSQPDLAVKFYEQAEALNTELNALGQQDTPHDIPRMMAAVMLAALAARLGRPEAAAYLDAGITCARAALPAAARHGANEMLIGFAEGVAAGSASLVEQVAAQLPPLERSQAYARAISPLAAYNLPAAKAVFAKISRAATDSFIFGKSAVALIPELGKSDPAEALALARSVIEPEHQPFALALAAAFQSREAAAGLYRDALAAAAMTRRSEVVSGWIAANAFQQDDALGRELFAVARQALVPSFPQDCSAGFAFFFAQAASDESRALIEKAYTQGSSGGVASDHGWDWFHAAVAMSAANKERALEMASALSEVNFRFDAQRKIAQYLLASDAVRATLRFDRWMATDTWKPGMPSGW